MNQVFAERLEQRMKELGLAAKDIHSQLDGIGPKRWEEIAGGLVPHSGTLEAVCQILECSKEWLKGECDEMHTKPSRLTNTWDDCYKWCTDPEYLGTKPPCRMANSFSNMSLPVPVWVEALIKNQPGLLTMVTEMEIQTLCQWLQKPSPRYGLPRLKPLVRGPRVVDMYQAKRRLGMGV